MPRVWNLSESRLVQVKAATSAANAESLGVGYPGPPDGKIWVVTACGYKPSVQETEVVEFHKTDGATGYYFALLNPVSLNLNPALATFIEQGMEYLLFPHEYICVKRAGHTEGSTMEAHFQFIEIDQPLYTYDEPQVVKRQMRAISSIRQAIGIANRGSRAGVVEGGGGESGGHHNLPK